MDTLSSMTLILAIATFILAGIAAYSIWQNYRLQKRERKERLLNEIIEWAIDVANIGFEESIISLPDAKDGSVKGYDMQRLILAKLSSIYAKCKELDSRSIYISFISQGLSKKLQKYVRDVSFRIDKLESFLGKSIKESKGTYISKGDELVKLKKSAQTLIEEATKIKTRDIG